MRRGTDGDTLDIHYVQYIQFQLTQNKNNIFPVELFRFPYPLVDLKERPTHLLSVILFNIHTKKMKYVPQ